MSSELTTLEKLRGIPWSIATFATNTFFVQFTFFGSVFSLFLHELGMSKGQMGFLFSLMPFFSLIAPVIAPWAARFGYKHTFLTFFGLRKLFTICLLLTPWVQSTFGTQGTLLFLSVIVACFAACRSVAETARIPWAQEYVPSAVQGKYTATNNFFTALAGFGAVGVASYVLGRSHSLNSFMVLIIAGVMIGMISVWCSAFIPGGAPRPLAAGQPKPQHALNEAIHDRNFLIYLACVGMLVLATVPVVSFIPLYMTEQMGLDTGNVVLLQMATLAGTLVTSYLWGWVADRYGSKPVMILGIGLRLLMPVALLFIPSHSWVTLYAAIGISLLQGVADMGWGVGSTRLLYVSVVPPEKKDDYMALYFAWIGLSAGVSLLTGGWMIDQASGLAGKLGPITLNAYSPLYFFGILLILGSLPLVHLVRADNRFGIGQFAGIFLRGNPFLAMGSLIRYQHSRNEHDAVLVTERLGEAKSLLTVDELLDALHDPRFQVRFEALISIARLRPEVRLREALIETLHGTELALAAMAAWALGRMGDLEALTPLRLALDTPYHSIRAHSTRAMGAMGAKEMAPLIRTRMADESDEGLQMAYASALGNLSDRESTGVLLGLLQATTNEKARLELALTLSRLVGDEQHFVHLVRRMRHDLGTTVAQELIAFKHRLERRTKASNDHSSCLADCTNAFAHQDRAEGLQS